VPGQGERLLGLRGIQALIEARGEERDSEVHSPFDSLIERDAVSLLGMSGPDHPRPGSAARSEVAHRVQAELERSMKGDERVRRDAARALSKVGPEGQLWGVKDERALKK
jgi:hypothetical protein